MRDLNEQATEIRQFLLGQLDKGRAEQLEARIFAEPDFAEEAQIIESELIAEYRVGNLNPDECRSFEQKYLTGSQSLRSVVEYENAFDEFIQAKRASLKPLPADGRPTPPETVPTKPEAKTPSTPQDLLKRESRLARLYSLLTARPAFAYPTLAAAFLLLSVGIWYLSSWYLTRPARDDSAQIERHAKEVELARLNSDAASPSRSKEVATIDLKPTQRDGGVTPRVPISDTREGDLIKLRLNLMQNGSARYRAVFLDDRRNELFAIPNLTAQDTPNGPQIWLFVPAQYLKRADYQIDLSRALSDGRYAEESTYTFRVIDDR